MLEYIEDKIAEFQKYKDSIYSENKHLNCRLTDGDIEQIDNLLMDLKLFDKGLLSKEMVDKFEKEINSLKTNLKTRDDIFQLLRNSKI